MMIRRFRSIPATAEILVAEGDRVLPDTAVARVEVLPGKLWRHDIARELCEEPANVPSLMVKEPGQKVSAGEVLAAGGDFFERRAVRSLASGVLTLVSRNLGFAYVREDVQMGSDEGPVTVNVTEQLGASPAQILLLKAANANVGAIVTKGQLLASRQYSFTWALSRTQEKPRATRVVSPIYGRITGISPIRGTITITPIFRAPQVLAYIAGTVSKVTTDGVEVSAEAEVLNGLWGLGSESWGPVQVLDGDLTGESRLSQGAVVVSRGTATPGGLETAREKRARGVILGYLPSETVMGFCGKVKNMGITGDEDVPFPLILVQGFFPARMDDRVYSVLRRSSGRVVSIRGVTHIRAGVMRPEIVVPADPGEGG